MKHSSFNQAQFQLQIRVNICPNLTNERQMTTKQLEKFTFYLTFLNFKLSLQKCVATEQQQVKVANAHSKICLFSTVISQRSC